MNRSKRLWELMLYQRWTLMILLICNILGTMYGYVWYSEQLNVTPIYFVPFVPDRPTASLFLCISIILMTFNRHLEVIDTLAFVSLLKYGIWAIIMNISMFLEQGDITLNGMMLTILHGIMTLEALYFYPRFKITILAGWGAFIWMMINDVIDYCLNQFPYYDFIATHTDSN